MSVPRRYQPITAGTTWHYGVWSTASTAWLCDQVVALPSGAEGQTGLKIRFRNTGTVSTHRGKVDYVRIIGTGPAGSWTASAQVSLIDPAAAVTVLKAYGAVDANPYDVTALYTGPGTYQIRLEENLGGTATLSDGTMEIQKAVVECDVSSCTGTSAPPPVQATGAGAAKFIKHPDGNILRVTYDAVTCNAQRAILLYGILGDWAGYAGCADDDLGNGGLDAAVDASGLENVWFNIVWTSSGTAGHPGFVFQGGGNEPRSWAVGTLCGMTGEDHGHPTCP